MNPRFRVPSRPYLQRNYLDTGFESSTKMLSIFLQYLDSAVWISSDAWKSRYGKFLFILLTVHFIDEDWNYRAVPVGAHNFKGRHINEQVWNHLVTMLIECGILQVTKEEYYFHPDVNVEEYEKVGHEFLHTYSVDHIHSWHKLYMLVVLVAKKTHP